MVDSVVFSVVLDGCGLYDMVMVTMWYVYGMYMCTM